MDVLIKYQMSISVDCLLTYYTMAAWKEKRLRMPLREMYCMYSHLFSICFESLGSFTLSFCKIGNASRPMSME